MTTPLVAAAEEHDPAVPSTPRPELGPTMPNPRPPTRRFVHLNAVIVLVVGLVLTMGLSIGAASLRNSNEKRLLTQRVEQAALVVGANVPSVQTPLASSAVLAEATGGDPDSFERFWDPIIDEDRLFQSASLWKVGTVDPRPLTVVGVAPSLARRPATERARYLARVFNADSFAVNNLLGDDDRRLGYGSTTHSRVAQYVVYAEAQLPRDRRSVSDADSAFAGLSYALYVGNDADPDQLLASSTGGASLVGEQSSTDIPFGDTSLRLVGVSETDLGGSFLARLPWLLAMTGVALTLAATTLVENLTRRRGEAEGLAAENAELYAGQRSVAQTLQHSLLPGEFPEIDRVEIDAKYVAGVEGIDIGGDWYDVVPLDGERVLLVVGDVSGRGLPAATMMASLRYSTRAYAAQGDSPAVILTKLSKLVSIPRDGHFATVQCAVLDFANATITVANAGHPEPLMLVDGRASFVKTATGPPVGVRLRDDYREVTAPLPPAATLLLYTDGLVERRGELLDVGLLRLQHAAERPELVELKPLLDMILNDVIPKGSDDDTALLGVRWRT
jgi:serine phosphatase RsbU (regulator of sigma subunit)